MIKEVKKLKTIAASSLLVFLFSFQTLSSEDHLREEFKIPLNDYLKLISKNLGYYFELDNRNCERKNELNDLLSKKFSIETKPKSSSYDHLSSLAETIGSDYDITIDLPLKSIRLSCANTIKIKADNE